MGNVRPGGEEPDPREEPPAEQLDRLLARAQNAFELDEAVLERLGTALMQYTELRSFRQRKGPSHQWSRRSLKHCYLLADGSSLALWELEHNNGPDDRLLHEVYTDPADLAEAQLAIDSRFDTRAPGELEEDLADWLGRTPLDMELPSFPREYTLDRSAEHAHRVLRRAENDDTPGDEVRLRLLSAHAHDIAFVTRRHARIAGRVVGWTLYEHAFLLEGGNEASLWELEHTMTPDGHPVCEVYEDEQAARDAADRRFQKL